MRGEMTTADLAATIRTIVGTELATFRFPAKEARSSQFRSVRSALAQCLNWVHYVVLTVVQPLPVFPHKQTFSGSVGMSQTCQSTKSLRDSPLKRGLPEAR